MLGVKPECIVTPSDYPMKCEPYLSLQVQEKYVKKGITDT